MTEYLVTVGECFVADLAVQRGVCKCEMMERVGHLHQRLIVTVLNFG